MNFKVRNPSARLTGVALLTFFVAVVTLLALNALVVMVVAGALSGIFSVEALNLSFKDSVVVSLALSVVGSFFRR